jgi:hypothetical protein
MKKSYRKKLKRNKTKKISRKKNSKKNNKTKRRKTRRKNRKMVMRTRAGMNGPLAFGLGAAAAAATVGLSSMGIAGTVVGAGLSKAAAVAYSNTLCQCNGCNSCRRPQYIVEGRPSKGDCSRMTPNFGPYPGRGEYHAENKWYPHNCCRGRFQNFPNVPQLDINGKCSECNLALANSLGYPTFQAYLYAQKVYSHGPGPYEAEWEYFVDERKGSLEEFIWRPERSGGPKYIYRSFPHETLYRGRYNSRRAHRQMNFEYAGSEDAEEDSLAAVKSERDVEKKKIKNVLDNWMTFIEMNKGRRQQRQHLIENAVRRFKENANLGWLPVWQSRWDDEELPEIMAQNPDITEEDLNERMKQSKLEFKASVYWKCPQCGVDVFVSKTECFRCQAPRPEGTGGGGGDGGGGYGGGGGE